MIHVLMGKVVVTSEALSDQVNRDSGTFVPKFGVGAKEFGTSRDQSYLYGEFFLQKWFYRFFCFKSDQ